MTALSRIGRWTLGVSLWAGACVVVAAPADDVAAQALVATHQKMGEALSRSPFGRPLLLDSVETPDGLTGDIYAEVERPLLLTLAVSQAGVTVAQPPRFL
ncbi:MAG: hypothetical protein EOO22_26585 [Comamonadaceae bacterium]|nr:MAG: hypothetical protein EOO22_26585 [Comamonadaceae bacterium]